MHYRKASTLSSPKVSPFWGQSEYCWFCISRPSHRKVTLENYTHSFQESLFINEGLPMTMAHSLSTNKTKIKEKKEKEKKHKKGKRMCHNSYSNQQKSTLDPF